MKKLRGKSQKLDLPGSKPEATEGRPRFATTVSANANMEEVLPPAEEIEAQFKEVVAQMGLPESKRAEFMAQPLRKKYELVKMMAKTMNKEQNSENEDSPHKIVNNIQSHGSVDVKVIRSLAVLLRSKPMYWVKDFLKENGLSVLLQLIESSAQNQGPVQTELVHCMRALLNNQEGMNAFLDEKKAGRILALYLDYKCCELEAVTQTLLLFALLCHYSDEGLGVVLDALSHYQSTKKTRAKLSDLIDSLGQVQNREYQTTCLMFVNAIINSPEDHDTRHEIITELKMLGVQDVVQKLKTSGQSDDTLNIQIRVLEEEISEDTQFTEEMRKDKRLVDSKTKIENIYLALMGKSDASSHMFSIIQHLAILADTDSIFKWREIDFMVKKAVMSAEAVDDQVPVDDDVKQLRERIMTQRQALRDLETKLNRERETLNAVVKGMLSGQMPQTLDQEFDLLKETYLLIAQLSGKEVGASAISAPILPDAHAPPPAPLTPGGSAAAPPPPAPAMRVPAPPPAPPAPPASAPGAPPPPPPGMKAPSGPPGPPPAPGVPPAPGAPPAAPDELVLPALPSRKPTKQTRNLHVNQINKNKVGKTIFVVNKVVESSHSVKVDFNELQDLFANETSPSARPHSPVGSGGKSTAQDKKQTVSLIDPKRSYNISIQLGSLKKYSYSQLKTLLIEMNETELSFETITLLKKIAPTPEEIEALNSYDGDKSALGEPEKLLMELAKVPNIVPRLDTWLFKLKFDEEICATRPDLDSVILAVQELKESKKLMEFLSIVLAITNFLNANSNKKDTYGFKMNSLLKLQDTKAANNQMNLLQYIAQVIETKYPSLVNFAETDLPHIPIAKRVAMSQIKESVTSMKRGLNMIESQIAAMENNKAELKDRYCIVMRSFKEKSTEEINFLEKRYEKLVSMLEELAQLYDEDKTLMKNSPETFFEDFDKFFNMLKEAHKANKERREKEVRAEQQGHKIEDNKLKGGAPRQLGDIIMGPRKHRQPSKHDEKGFLDGMEKTLRDGSGFRNQRASRRLSGAEMKNLAASLTNHPLSDSYVPESPNNNNNNSSSNSSNQSFSITRQAPPGSIRLPVPPPTILLNHEKRVSQ